MAYKVIRNPRSKKLAVDLKPFSYFKVPTNGVGRQESCPITFTLVVDNFGIQYVDRANRDHLEAVPQENCPMSLD